MNKNKVQEEVKNVASNDCKPFKKQSFCDKINEEDVLFLSALRNGEYREQILNLLYK